jgi:hypothetical protein
MAGGGHAKELSDREDRVRTGEFLRGSIAWLAVGLAITITTSTALAQVSEDAAPGSGRPQAGSTDSGKPDFRPLLKPSLHVAPARGEIVLDGELDDPGWEESARVTSFSENFPDEQAEPEVPSEAWVTYDQGSLYLALIAYDDPSTVRASLRDRDQIWQDDYFGILLDTYGDASWAYFLFANPLGIQGDTRFATSAGEDDRFDILYYSEGKITDFGYVIEMRIPFESLRFPDRPEQEWRATFWRTRPRASREQYTWAAMDRDESCFLCQYGTLTGIEGVKPGGALELLPTMVTSQSGQIRDFDDPRSGLDNGGLDADPSLGLRYSFPAGITADLAVNPDFSQVESDVAQIDINSTFALFFPERRRLFQEGSDVFESFIDAVFTRSINDPQVAGKAIGRMGRTTFGYIGALDENSPILIPFEERSFIGQTGKSVSNIARGRQTFLEDSYAGALLTDRRYVDHSGSNTAIGADGTVRFLDKYRFEWQAVATHTDEPDDPALTEGINGLTFDRGRHTARFDGESFWGHAEYASIERDARTWNFDFDYWAYSPTFRVDNGFETRNDLRRVSMFQGLNFWPESDIFDRIGPGMFARREWNWEGVRKRDFVQWWVNASLKGQTTIEPSFQIERERFAGVEFGGMRRFNLFVNSNFSEPVRLGFFVSRGDRIARNVDSPVMGTGTNAEVFATIKLFRRLVLEPELAYADLFEQDGGPEIFKGFVFRTRASFQFNRELSLRMVVQWDDFNGRFDVEPLVTYRINPFTVFFAGMNSSYTDYGRRDDLLDPLNPAGLVQTRRQFFAKFQYLLRM